MPIIFNSMEEFRWTFLSNFVAYLTSNDDHDDKEVPTWNIDFVSEESAHIFHFILFWFSYISAELMPFIKSSRFGMRSERDNLNFNSPNKLFKASTSSQNGLVLGKKLLVFQESRSCVGLENTRQKVVESQLSLRDRDADSHASTVLNDFTLSTRNSSPCCILAH